MRKLFVTFLITMSAVFLAIPFFTTNMAATDTYDTDVVAFVKTDGKGDGSSPENATYSLNTAFDNLDMSKDCTIIICGEYNQTGIFNRSDTYTGKLTFTSVYNGVDYRTQGAKYITGAANVSRFVCTGETIFKDINIEVSAVTFVLAAQYHPVTIDTGVDIFPAEGNTQFKGTRMADSFEIIAGSQNGQNATGAVTESSADAHVTVKSGGPYVSISAFSRTGVTGAKYTGTSYITLSDEAKIANIYVAQINSSNAICGNTVITLSDNASIQRVYGANGATTMNSVTLNWKSGTIGQLQFNDITFNGSKKLVYSSAASKTDNFNTIALNFDVIEAESGTTPVTTAPPADTTAPVTTASPVTTAPAVTTASPVTTAPPAATGTATVAYVKTSGTGDGSSPDKATSSLNTAMNSLDLSKDCTVVICGEYTQAGIINRSKTYTGSVTFTSVYSGVDYRTQGAKYITGDSSVSRFVCSGETIYKDINIEVSAITFVVAAQYFPVTIDTGVDIFPAEGNTEFTGDKISTSFQIIAGSQNGKNANGAVTVSSADAHVTVKSGGPYVSICAFSRSAVDGARYTGTSYINLSGNAKIAVLFVGQINSTGAVLGNTVVTMKDNASIGTISGADKKTTMDSVIFNWQGGTIGQVAMNNITFNNGTKLVYSDAAKSKNINFELIAQKFKTVESESGEIQPETTPATGSAPLFVWVAAAVVAAVVTQGVVANKKKR